VVFGHGPLREPLEAFLWALEHGERSLAENIVRWGSALEGFAERPLEEVQHFWAGLERQGEMDFYFDKAQEYIRPDRVIFTGYLTHRELRYLFPCCDAAVFPSVVAEAGPLVFLESLASGCFPMGTYFAGMAASIDSVAAALPPEDAELMQLSADAAQTVADIVAKTPHALELGDRHKETLRRVAVERYDWSSVARKFAGELQLLGQ
jgi:glycosyltransferase involved in cell wall biosynthesis